MEKQGLLPGYHYQLHPGPPLLVGYTKQGINEIDPTRQGHGQRMSTIQPTKQRDTTSA